MNVTEVHFQRVVPTKPYANYTMGATALLDEGEDAMVAMLRLTTLVDNACARVPDEPEASTD
jgi:hypothetical protein